jgi:hypothetical protein
MSTFILAGLYILPVVIALSVIWLIAPEKAMAYFSEMSKVVDRPADMIMCGSVIACVLLAWPWTEDGRIYFRDLKEECEYRGKWREDICFHPVNKAKDYVKDGFVCCSAICPKLKEEKEKRDGLKLD